MKNKSYLIFTAVQALPCEWPMQSGQLEPYINGSQPVVIADSPEDCQTECVKQTSFICAAVNYKLSDKTCELLAENNQTASVAEPIDDSWQYFLRPICAGNRHL